MSEFQSWEDYFIPGTEVLRNKLGVTDSSELRRIEYNIAALAEVMVRVDAEIVPRTFDLKHMRHIHRHLFQDVYEWAGEVRAVNFTKADESSGFVTTFASVEGGKIASHMEQVRGLVEATTWSGISHDEFAVRAAEVFAHVNYAHPFREGNGRTAKIFMEHVAELSPFELDYGRIDQKVWNQRSAFSGPYPGSDELHPHELVPVFMEISTARQPDPDGIIVQEKLDRLQLMHGAGTQHASAVGQDLEQRLKRYRGNER